MTSVEFGPLPGPPLSPRVDWKPVAEALRGRAGDWAKIATKETPAQANNLAMSIKRGLFHGFRPQGHYQAATRGCDVWARYVGEQS